MSESVCALRNYITALRGSARLPASQVLAAASELGLLACFLAVLTTVLPVGATLLDRALATWVSAFFRVSHDAPFAFASTPIDQRSFGRPEA